VLCPAISIVIPAYNAQKYIATTIDSVLAQDYLDYEIVVVNDGSKDGTLDVLNTFKTDKLRVYTQDNAGVSAARNKAIALAKAPYIYFLDADDILTNDALRRCISAIKNNNKAIAVYGEALTFEDSTDLGNIDIYNQPTFNQRPSGNILGDIISHNFVACGSVIMVKKEALEKTALFSTNIRLGEDWALWVELATLGEFIYIPSPVICFYRQHPTSAARTLALSVNEMDPAIDYIFNLEKVKQAFNAKDLSKLKNQAKAGAYCYTAQEYLKNRAFRSAKRIYLKALRLTPFHLRTLILFTCSTLHVLPNAIHKKLK